MKATKAQIAAWLKIRESWKKNTPVEKQFSPTDKILRRQELEADPEEWKRYMFPKYHKYKSPPFHKKSSLRIIKNFLGLRHWYEVRHWARGLSKTTVTMMDILYLVLTGKLRNIIYTSSNWDSAAAFLEKYRIQLDSNDRIKYFYGEQELPGSWQVGNFTTRDGVKFLALGAGQSPRGNGNEEIRPDCIIVDDFDTDEECRNPDIINKKWDWFEKALFFTVDTAEPYLVIWLGNIIAEDCCVVRAGAMADHCEIINIRDKNGISVWPDKNSEKDIDYQLSKVSYESGQQEMFNNPIISGKVFKELTYGICPDNFQFLIVYADPAPSNKDRPGIKAKAQNSCKAVVIVGCVGNKYYVVKCWVDNCTNSTFIDWLYAARDEIGTSTQPYFFIENNTLQNPFYEQVLLPLVFQKGNEHPKGVLPISPDERQKPDKYFRIEGNLEPLNRLGLLILNEAEKSNPHMKRLEAQFKSVSANSKTMDGPDAVEGGVYIAKNKSAIAAAGDVEFIPMPKNKKRF